jgi:2-methylcitrate dehydratase
MSSNHSFTDEKTLSAIQAKKALAGDKVVFLARNTNQALGIAEYAINFLGGQLGSGPDDSVISRTEQFHTDSVVCGLSALALNTNAPHILRNEALDYSNTKGAKVFGSKKKSYVEKAILANCSAVREWDSNGTVFGYNNKLGSEHRAGEFGHNDFYPVAVAACQEHGLDGAKAILAMIAIDEIRGRLAEVFSLKTYHIDHVVHGAIASAAVYGALVGANAKQIESAIGTEIEAHLFLYSAIHLSSLSLFSLH